MNLSIETYGRKILRPEYNAYSNCLRGLLLHCLARDPTQRPTPRQLLNQCQKSLKTYELGPFPGIPEGDLATGREEEGGPGWYSGVGSVGLLAHSNFPVPQNDPADVPPLLPHAEPMLEGYNKDWNCFAVLDEMDVAEE